MIEINNLSFNYDKKDQLFKNTNLKLPQGGICGLLGENGSGKTTLLKIIAGLIFPLAGSCSVMGYEPRFRSVPFLEDIYFLPEDIYLPALTAKEYVRLYSPFYPKFNLHQWQGCIKEFELPVDKLLTELSYGQKKKFLISFGLATNCNLFILDEPTNGLDIPSKSQFRKLLAANITDDKLFIISTHQVHDVENLIDSLVVMEQGEVIFQQSLFDVSYALSFTLHATQPIAGSYFYCEKQLGGYRVVAENTTKQDTHVDLEILFNAIRANKAKLQQYFMQRQ